MGGSPIPFLQDDTWWLISYVLIGMWQSMGWRTIVYLAAITSVNTELYEAARVDGAGRFKQCLHVTLPCIHSTIAYYGDDVFHSRNDSGVSADEIMKNNFTAGIPDSLVESALIDGAGHFRILVSVVLPLSKPILATIALFYAAGRWNTYSDALYYIKQRTDLRPLQLKLYYLCLSICTEIFRAGANDWSCKRIGEEYPKVYLFG